MKRLLLAGCLGLGLCIAAGPLPAVRASDDEEEAKPEPAIFGHPLSHWVDQLKDRDPGRRVMAVYAIGRLGEDAADVVPKLVKQLGEDKDLSVRRSLGWALKRIDPDAAAKAGVP